MRINNNFMNGIDFYLTERDKQINSNSVDGELKQAIKNYTDNIIRTNYIKNFSYLGVPIMQYPSDLMALQELIWNVKPRIIIETGAAFLGQTVFLASMQELIGSLGVVLSIDIEFKQDNIQRVSKFPFMVRTTLLKGDSVSRETKEKVSSFIKGMDGAIMVILDSNHTEDHVLKELEIYSEFVTKGSYIIVNDTSIECWADKYPPVNRPWGKGNNPMTAVNKFLIDNDNFVSDWKIETLAGITGCPNGWLKRIK